MTLQHVKRSVHNAWPKRGARFRVAGQSDNKASAANPICTDRYKKESEVEARRSADVGLVLGPAFTTLTIVFGFLPPLGPLAPCAPPSFTSLSCFQEATYKPATAP
ncbi:hypothetical protein OH76DRAFT_1208202 [Lentinus brumalis]|uniref:Uncharacterized protein n=1 Tax=Lentinus brumalis TaxID=2498619 RepID=A0A371DL76_9APHY|nr:hypothetical protein OH76DRAFT_1208202 [Polyporus brumalis]